MIMERVTAPGDMRPHGAWCPFEALQGGAGVSQVPMETAEEQVSRIMRDRVTKPEKKVGEEWITLNWRNGRLVVQVDRTLYTKVYRPDVEEE